MKRRKFESGEAPEPGQVWQLYDGGTFYLVKRKRDRYAKRGETWVSLNVASGVTVEVFFNAQDKHTPWQRIA